MIKSQPWNDNDYNGASPHPLPSFVPRRVFSINTSVTLNRTIQPIQPLSFLGPVARVPSHQIAPLRFLSWLGHRNMPLKVVLLACTMRFFGYDLNPISTCAQLRAQAREMDCAEWQVSPHLAYQYEMWAKGKGRLMRYLQLV